MSTSININKLAELMDSCADEDGQWDGADVCDALAGLIAMHGGWADEPCPTHGVYPASHDACPRCTLEDRIVIEISGMVGGPFEAVLTDPDEPMGTPFGVGVGKTAREAVAALVNQIVLVGE